MLQGRFHNGKKVGKNGNFKEIKIEGQVNLIGNETFRVEISLLRPEPVEVDVRGVGLQSVVDL